ncbi:MAG: trigger factor [Sorangiineae bacterium]|nr:trigger factor [Polyangiaceae bacterium]MEB2324713.1 trigger factor [Sorangiineae bacterium]
MQVNVQKLSPVLVEFDVVVDAVRVKSEFDKAFAAVARSARVRGFRPGKAPRKVLAQMFGSRIAADVAQRLVDETFPKATDEQQLQPVSAPDIEPQKVVETEPFTYKARFEIVPEISELKWTGLEAKRETAAVTDEMITAELDKLRRANSTLEAPAEARPAKTGDVVTIDFTVEVDGSEVADAGAKDFQVELGAGQLIAAIDEALVGKAPGAHAHASVDMPPSHPHAGLRGKQATFHLSLTDVKERILPAADDEFAKDLGEYETLADLKKDLKDGLEKQAKEASDNALAEQLVNELVKANPIPVPPSLVRRQMQITEQEVLGMARRQGQSPSRIPDEVRARIQADSESKVRAGLLMAEIAKREAIKIGDPELEEGMKELAEQTGKNLAKLRVEYRDAKKREMLIGMILENKVLDLIEAKAAISNA